ncbi:MAG TPA: response regulator [Anaeromyxobacteraceae bacterium]|nr:response regulator [Anaeromyxobacteraceae bacterium]
MVQRQRGPTINVLLVEDDEGLRKAVERGLTKAGYSVAAAGSGREALELVRTSTPDAVVMDVLLPDSGGLGIARAMRQHRELRSLPILFVTALSPAAVRDTLFPAPVLFKPFTYRQLVASVRDLVRGSRHP